jgi:hypothetical protein
MTGTVVLFAGHRIDEPGRTPPRFPPECEASARRAIESALRTLAAEHPPVLGIAGAADGGDILFHEVCAELGIASEVCLALPAAEYIQTSVRASWAPRFQHLIERHPTASLGPCTGNVWQADHEWQMRRARERNAERTVLLALLGDDETTETPGGTLEMVRMARENGIEVIQMDARQLCA